MKSLQDQSDSELAKLDAELSMQLNRVHVQQSEVGMRKARGHVEKKAQIRELSLLEDQRGELIDQIYDVRHELGTRGKG